MGIKWIKACITFRRAGTLLTTEILLGTLRVLTSVWIRKKSRLLQNSLWMELLLMVHVCKCLTRSTFYSRTDILRFYLSSPTNRAADQRSQWEMHHAEMSDSQSVGPLFNPRVIYAVQSHRLSLIAQLCNI